MSNIIVRYPPSPTGLFHIGTARTVLYNFLFAQQNKGKAIMRMEDTDKIRSEKKYEENILAGIKKLGMHWDGEVEYQSTRGDIYKKFLKQLLDEKKAYYCFSTPEELNALREQAQKEKKAFKYPGTWRDANPKKVEEKIAAGEKSVIRFALPLDRGDISFNDTVRGEVKINIKELDDFVIAKNLDTALYNFCVVVDDYDMNVSDVIRGEDHISNTPKQILVFEAFGWKIPRFSHLPLILNHDKSKLSKRKNKVSVDDYLAEGFLPEAIVNFLALLGWNTSDEQEIFSLSELIDKFSLERVHKGGAVFDIQKLEWVNGEWIKKMSLDEFASRVLAYWKENNVTYPDHWQKVLEGDNEFFLQSLLLIKDRTKKLSDVSMYLELFYVDDSTISYSTDIYLHKKMKTSAESAPESLGFALKVIEGFSGTWTIENLKAEFVEKISAAGQKNGFILFPLRVALSGEEFSPGTLELLEILGRERSIVRIKRGIELCSSSV